MGLHRYALRVLRILHHNGNATRVASSIPSAAIRRFAAAIAALVVRSSLRTIDIRALFRFLGVVIGRFLGGDGVVGYSLVRAAFGLSCSLAKDTMYVLVAYGGGYRVDVPRVSFGAITC